MRSREWLFIEDLHVSYGGIKALRGISLEVAEGEIVALIGPNGAGKSTLLNTISGLIRPKQGSLTFNGVELAKLRPHQIVRLGIAQVPEGRKVFTRLSVRENLLMGGYTTRQGQDVLRAMETVFELFPRLRERMGQVAGTLSGGEQQMLAIGRALMANPVLLMLDEPSMGLAPIVVETIFETLLRINSKGTTLFLVEQRATMAIETARRCYLIQSGAIVLEGTGQEFKDKEELRKLYLDLG